jgi:hypothetical protein
VGEGEGKAFNQLDSLKKHMNKLHRKTLARLRGDLANQGRTISQGDLELRSYFKSLDRKHNRKAYKQLSLSEHDDHM